MCAEIVSRIPEHICYVEPFCGAAWTFFRKTPSKVEVINDLNGDVSNFFRVLQHHPEEFLRHFKFALCSREHFERERDMPPQLLTDIQRAARFYYVQKMSFGGRVRSPSFGYSAQQPPRFNLLRMEEELSLAHLRLARVYVEHLPYKDVFLKYDRPQSFFYVDPPYVGTEGVYGRDLFHQIDHEKLAALLRSLQGKFLLSQADSPLIRELYEGFSIDQVQARYSCGKSNREIARELLISNMQETRRT